MELIKKEGSFMEIGFAENVSNFEFTQREI